MNLVGALLLVLVVIFNGTIESQALNKTDDPKAPVTPPISDQDNTLNMFSGNLVVYNVTPYDMIGQQSTTEMSYSDSLNKSIDQSETTTVLYDDYVPRQTNLTEESISPNTTDSTLNEILTTLKKVYHFVTNEDSKLNLTTIAPVINSTEILPANQTDESGPTLPEIIGKGIVSVYNNLTSILSYDIVGKEALNSDIIPTSSHLRFSGQSLKYANGTFCLFVDVKLTFMPPNAKSYERSFNLSNAESSGICLEDAAKIDFSWKLENERVWSYSLRVERDDDNFRVASMTLDGYADGQDLEWEKKDFDIKSALGYTYLCTRLDVYKLSYGSLRIDKFKVGAFGDISLDDFENKVVTCHAGMSTTAITFIIVSVLLLVGSLVGFKVYRSYKSRQT